MWELVRFRFPLTHSLTHSSYLCSGKVGHTRSSLNCELYNSPAELEWRAHAKLKSQERKAAKAKNEEQELLELERLRAEEEARLAALTQRIQSIRQPKR